MIEKFVSGKFSKISVKRKHSFNKLLNQLFKFDKLDNEELLMLKQLATLPSIEMPFKFLEVLFDRKNNIKFEELLDYLCDNGWLIKLERGYKLHQIIKEYILSTHLPSFEEVEIVLDSLLKVMGKTNDTEVAADNKDNLIYFESLAKVLMELEIKNKKVGTFLNKLGNINYFLSMYEKSKLFYYKALKIRKKILGVKHLSVAISYNNLANLYQIIGNYNDAESLYLKAIKIKEKLLGKEHPYMTIFYNNLANLYQIIGDYSDAETLYLKAIEIKEDSLGREHPDMTMFYNNLANLYRANRNYSDAESLYLKALNIREKGLGKEHLNTAISYNNLAIFYDSFNQIKKAKFFMNLAS